MGKTLFGYMISSRTGRFQEKVISVFQGPVRQEEEDNANVDAYV